MANSTSQEEYHPIHLARSDGKGYPNLDHHALNLKEDQDIQQLERWEVIIAGHLAHQLAPKEEKRQFKLAGFPRGYELRCAIRKDGGRDYYMYGHPYGPKSTYRTPGDFVLHLIWLASDSPDHSHCSCDLCTKMVEANKQRLSQNTVTESQPQPQPQNAVSSSSIVPAQFAQAQILAQAQQHSAQPTQGVMSGPPLCPGTTHYTNVFRAGEMVWYKHQAWRLGLILAIQPKPNNLTPNKTDHDYAFLLAPLGHEMLKQQNVTKDVMDMRPFLTFSVPDVSFPELQDKSYPDINWKVFAQQKANESKPEKMSQQMQAVGLDASKMAARYINDSFSTFNKLREEVAPDGQSTVQTYTGLYLGAEMIHLKDAIRVAESANQPAVSDSGPNTTLVMIVSTIDIVKPFSAAAIESAPLHLRFRGNLYRLMRYAAKPPHPLILAPPETLAPALAEEAAVRNQIERDKSMRWGWELAQQDAERAETEVLGRFYVTHKLLGIIDRDRFQEQVNAGIVQGAQSYLNNRSHSGWGRYIGRKDSRAVSVGAAVLTPFQAPEGMVED
ncbi:transcription-silencing protein Clr2-domain-containing protein [Bombardia bombarda]|uniref:Transcription-silencing protein Clr2-domain-containing protein n=1 Tax=Bombardia bombarda TaxID=252184 RepID=A0AA39XMX0_9PEZI|nr:transcription-silencing protein Clr2-domain-containing protein [Bombardia bombarda]